MSQIIVDLTEELAKQLAEASRESNTAPAELAREMIERSLWVRRFDLARQQIIAALGSDAPATDEDAFREIKEARQARRK